jgi:hypothetical protein
MTKKIVYMDKVDFDHELGNALGGNKVYRRRRENPYFCPQKFARFGQTSLG